MTWYKWSTTAASNSTADSTINWAEGQAPSTINDSARAMMAAAAKYRIDMSGITTGGTSTAYTVTTNQVFSSLTVLDTNVICIIPHTTSGASPTLAVDGLTAKAINKTTGVAVDTGALISGNPYLLRYSNSANEFLLLDRTTVTLSGFSSGQLALARGGTNADLSATGGTSQVLQQISAGAAITVGQLAATDLSDTITGSGNLVKATSPTLTTPTISNPTVTTGSFTSPTMVTPTLGVASATSLAASGAITSSSASAGVGYATGAGSTVTQLTSLSTSVTINAVSGAITTATDSLSTGNNVVFTVVNSRVAATDVIVINGNDVTTSGRRICWVEDVGSGSFKIHIYCTSSFSSESWIINFVVLKGVTS